ATAALDPSRRTGASIGTDRTADPRSGPPSANRPGKPAGAASRGTADTRETPAAGRTRPSAREILGHGRIHHVRGDLVLRRLRAGPVIRLRAGVRRAHA